MIMRGKWAEVPDEIDNYITNDGNFVNFADAIGAAPSSYLDNLSEINFDLDKNIKP